MFAAYSKPLFSALKPVGTSRIRFASSALSSRRKTNPPPVLKTFHLPDIVTGSFSDKQLAREFLLALTKDGIFQVSINDKQSRKTEAALDASKEFFRQPFKYKSNFVSDLSYSGYIASGEEVTAGEADYSEIFTVTKDLPLNDKRVREMWPCHGPCPWPNLKYTSSMVAFMDELGHIGEKLLQLTALGLGLNMTSLTDLTVDGWHHMRVLRFPTATPTSSARGIGAHTDYGLLVIAAQDGVGGLFVRPPIPDEKRKKNWIPGESSSGMYQNDDKWTFVTPVPKVLTVFPGDMLQFITNGYVLSTPHKVRLANRERFALAYFHEPNFNACIRPLMGSSDDDYIHYGTHFTNMFMRNYPERVTTKRIHEEKRLDILAGLKEGSVRNGSLTPMVLTTGTKPTAPGSEAGIFEMHFRRFFA